MNLAKKLMLAAAAVSAAACSSVADETAADDLAAANFASVKFVNSPAEADSSTLLLYFDEQTADAAEQLAAAAATRGAVTRSGAIEVDDVLAQIGATSLRRIFPCDPRSEERTRKEGLHRWYMVELDGECDVTEAARLMAPVAQVERIEFNTRLTSTADRRAVPLSAVAATTTATRAANGPFNDPYMSLQWNLANSGSYALIPTARPGADVDVVDAWNFCAGNREVIVAVVDEGVKYSHPDLQANMWVNTAELNGTPGVDDDGNGFVDDIYGYNFAHSKGAISWDAKSPDGKNDDSGHGTHIAGVIAGVNNNSRGICGIAGGTGNGDGVRIMSCQVMSGNSNFSGTAAVVAAAAKYAADNGASILQCSFGYSPGTFSSDSDYEKRMSVEKQAFDYFVRTANCPALDGGLVIFAAGNDTVAAASYPAAYHDYISVTSFSPDFLPAYYTNYGAGCNIAAPGGDFKVATDNVSSSVLSTLPPEVNQGEDYGYMQGTSMAAPHVSGVAALGLSYAVQTGQRFTADEFRSMLLTAVSNIDRYLDGMKQNMNLALYYKNMGTGATDALRLLMQVEGTPCLRATVGTSQLLTLTEYFGEAASNLTYIDVTMSTSERSKLGVTEAPSISYGKLRIHCRKPGVARLTVRAIAGGSVLGDGTTIGGMEISKEFAVIARDTGGSNGGWL